jgi:hypothetical protein
MDIAVTAYKLANQLPDEERYVLMIIERLKLVEKEATETLTSEVLREQRMINGLLTN